MLKPEEIILTFFKFHLWILKIIVNIYIREDLVINQLKHMNDQKRIRDKFPGIRKEFTK